MSEILTENHDPVNSPEPNIGHEPNVHVGHDGAKGRDPKETLERRSSKSRLSKQDEVEDIEDEQDQSPSSEASDATLIPMGVDTPVVRTPGGSPECSSPDDVSKIEPQRSVDSDKSSPTQGNPKAKLLVRSKAVCDDASPPPEDPGTAATNTTTTLSTSNSASVSPVPTTMATLAVSPTPHRRHKLEKDNSQGSVSDNSNSPMLSRDSSMEYYTDSTGTDLESFIKMTLNKNRNDRITLLELETKMTKFIKDTKQQYYKFHQMSSYHRMLVHRVAAFFGLDHNVDQSGKCVVVNRTSNTRTPDFRFTDHISDEMTDDQPKKLLKRDDRLLGGSLDERSPERMSLGKKSKSLEERKDHYEKVKNRIFSDSPQDVQVSEVVPITSSYPSIHKSSLTSSKDDPHWSRWSSADSSGYSTDNSLKITKASSFPSYVLSRTSSTSSARLSKTDSLNSGASGLTSPMTRPATIPSSPPSEPLSESSGSNQSATSPAQIHPQTGDAHSPGPVAPSFYDDKGQPLAIWVATSTGVIPPGSIIINQQTCQPYLNSDGSPLRWVPGHQDAGGQMMVPQALSVPYPQHAGVVPQQTHVVSNQQGDVYPNRQYNGQQVNEHLGTSGSQPFPQQQESSSSGEIGQRVAQLTLSPQHSTESLPPEPPSGMTGQQIYSNIPQQQAPQGYNQLQPQVPYFVPNTSTCNPQLRIVYQSSMAYQRPSAPGQGQMEVQGQGQVLSQPGQGQPVVPPANGQYAAPPSAYQSPFSQLTVHSVETYQQQGYQPTQQHENPASGYSADLSTQQHGAPPIQPQDLPATAPINYNQYMTPGGADPGVQQNAYVPVPGYIQPGGGTGAANPHVVAFQGTNNPGGHQVTGQYLPSQTSATYRPKSPPSQVAAVSNLTPQGTNGVPAVSIGQPMPNISANAPQYMSFTYPGQQQNTAAQQAAPPQPTPQVMGIVPRHQIPQLWNHIPQGIGSGQAPTQAFPVMRNPAVPIGDNRYIGQPLQQVHPPQIQPLFSTTARPRVPTPIGGPNQGAGNASKVVKAGGHTMEIYDLPSHITSPQLESYLADLIKMGASIHILGDDETSTQNSAPCERTVVAVFDSEYAAGQAQSCQLTNQYKLRPLSLRNFESSDLATISEHSS